MAAIRHEARGAAREPDGGTPGRVDTVVKTRCCPSCELRPLYRLLQSAQQNHTQRNGQALLEMIGVTSQITYAPLPYYEK